MAAFICARMYDKPPYQVCVSHENGMWIGVCDALGLVTEAESYEGLMERAWEIAPELAAANHLSDSPDSIRMSFLQTQSASHRVAL
ncbi:hypothetical protein AGMMS50225_27180 [Betaproteobacteria bacterium]|nr:hypothetical protein AGMMS50225_27180 [Betaproteobacteria bacterium]